MTTFDNDPNTPLVRGFLWCETEVASRGTCVVVWVNSCVPNEMGGLNNPNLGLIGMALRMRWLWLAHMDPNKIWTNFKSPLI